MFKQTAIIIGMLKNQQQVKDLYNSPIKLTQK